MGGGGSGSAAPSEHDGAPRSCLLPGYPLLDCLVLDPSTSARCVFVTQRHMLCLRLERTPMGHLRYHVEAHVRLSSAC